VNSFEIKQSYETLSGSGVGHLSRNTVNDTTVTLQVDSYNMNDISHHSYIDFLIITQAKTEISFNGYVHSVNYYNNSIIEIEIKGHNIFFNDKISTTNKTISRMIKLSKLYENSKFHNLFK
jgi:hypothetical protein